MYLLRWQWYAILIFTIRERLQLFTGPTITIRTRQGRRGSWYASMLTCLLITAAEFRILVKAGTFGMKGIGAVRRTNRVRVSAVLTRLRRRGWSRGWRWSWSKAASVQCYCLAQVQFTAGMTRNRIVD